MSGFWFDTNASSSLDSAGARGVPTGYLDNFAAGFDEQVKLNNSNSQERMLSDAYDARAAAIEKETGKKLKNPFKIFDPNPSDKLGRKIMGKKPFREEQIDSFENEVAALRKQHPGLETRDQMWKRLSQAANTLEEGTADISDRSTSTGTFGNFFGQMTGTMIDPVNAAATIVTLPVGGEGGAALQVLRAGLREAAVNIGAETLVQTEVQPFRKKLDLESGVVPALKNIGIAGAGGFLFGSVFKGAELGSDKLFGKELIDEFDKKVPKPTPEQKTAREAIQRQLDDDAMSPLPDTAPAAAEHISRLHEAVRALEEERPADMADMPKAKPVIHDTPVSSDNLNKVVYAFDPKTLLVDAKTFQFKEGGDGAGVTERLKGVTSWDPVKAGQVLVYEYADGGRFIADGHQRLGLAKRLQAEGGSHEVKIYGQLFKEADGFSPDDVRVVAAMKNIAEGTGTAIDAAKVLRVAPERIGELPPASALVRQARDLTNLSDDAFGMVVNDVVPANYAAIAGRLAPDDADLQKAVLDVLAKTDPANTVQAESIVRQAIDAGMTRETQTGLFGEEVVSSSLFGERAKVLDRALKTLRQDRKLFDSLVRNEARIEAEGNVLNKDINASQADVAGQVEQVIQALANRKGAVSDALTEAARRFKDERKLASAADDFIDAVRTAAQRPDFDGSAAGGSGRDLASGIENAPRPLRPGEPVPEPSLTALKEFDLPAGRGAEMQSAALEAELRASVDQTAAGDQSVIPGAERISDKEAAERGAEKPLQSDKQQKPADEGLFDIAGRSQEDFLQQLDKVVPVAERVDPETGKIVSEFRSIDDVLKDADMDKADIDAIGGCKL